jgi:hypothetical protein
MGEARRRYSARGGIERTIITDDADPSKFYVHHQQDVEPILESIARDREIMRNNGDGRLTHRIPTIVYEELQRAGIADDPPLFKTWLNSSEADPWRIWNGRL